MDDVIELLRCAADRQRGISDTLDDLHGYEWTDAWETLWSWACDAVDGIEVEGMLPWPHRCLEAAQRIEEAAACDAR